MAQLRMIQTDAKKESEGIWRAFPGTNFRVKIARAGNPSYRAALMKLQRTSSVEELRSSGSDAMSNETVLHAAAPAIAEHIILDWENLEDDEGNPIPYTVKQAIEFIRDSVMKDWAMWVLEIADNRQNYMNSIDEEDAGNLTGSSDGPSSMEIPQLSEHSRSKQSEPV